jgi:DNA polymerase-3 subunit epsilon
MEDVTTLMEVGAGAEAQTGFGDMMVLHRLRPRPVSPRCDQPGTRLGICVDVETTGIRSADEVIELAALPFTYRPSDGAILAVHEPFVRLRQPSIPIPPEITALTGIDDAMVAAAVAAGRTLDIDELDAVFAPAALILAHNASFDRRHLERLHPKLFENKPFACTIEDAGWDEEGVESPKLAYVAALHYDFFYEKHRATADCHAVVEILGRKPPISEGTVLAKVLESARRGRHRVRAFGTPFAEKDALRARRYKWDPGGDGRPKNWYRDVRDAAAAEEERALLSEGLFAPATDVSISWLSAFDRFSSRI